MCFVRLETRAQEKRRQHQAMLRATGVNHPSCLHGSATYRFMQCPSSVTLGSSRDPSQVQLSSLGSCTLPTSLNMTGLYAITSQNISKYCPTLKSNSKPNLLNEALSKQLSPLHHPSIPSLGFLNERNRILGPSCRIKCQKGRENQNWGKNVTNERKVYTCTFIIFIIETFPRVRDQHDFIVLRLSWYNKWLGIQFHNLIKRYIPPQM